MPTCQCCNLKVEPDLISVVVDSFKPSGKWYAQGCVHVSKIDPISKTERILYDIWKDVEVECLEQRIPGLAHGSSGFYVLLTVPDHLDNHPKLWIPPELRLRL